jgi:poly-gamma-glutamate synthesis protein (capsule biosynthesis protein)
VAGSLHAAEPFVPGASVSPVLHTDDLPPLVLSFVGDIMHHERNAEMPDYDRLYDAVAGLLQIDDLSFANVEFPIDPSRPPAGYPIFNGSVAYLEAAVRAGFDVFALANNHTFDLGVPGVAATRSVMESVAAQSGVVANGIRARERGPIELSVIVHRGWRIGFVSITSISNAGSSWPHIHLVNYFDDRARAEFLSDVSAWRDEVDLLIVGIHAGDEYIPQPAPHKVEFFRQLADAGASIVWGHHSHVLQPWERRGESLIIYSAGNFISAQRRYQSPFVPFGRWAPTGDTAIYQVRVEASAARAAITEVRTPAFTTIDDPVHGLVLRSFEDVLAGPLDRHWRAFYFARYSAMRGLGSGQQFAPDLRIPTP